MQAAGHRFHRNEEGGTAHSSTALLLEEEERDGGGAGAHTARNCGGDHNEEDIDDDDDRESEHGAASSSSHRTRGRRHHNCLSYCCARCRSCTVRVEQEYMTPMRSFFGTFFRQKGAAPIFMIAILFSFGVASCIGVIPEIMSDRYARLYYGYNGTVVCSSITTTKTTTNTSTTSSSRQLLSFYVDDHNNHSLASNNNDMTPDSVTTTIDIDVGAGATIVWEEDHNNTAHKGEDKNDDVERVASMAACKKGYDHAQNMAASSSLVMNIMALLCNPIIGSMSDRRGRKYLISMCIFLSGVVPSLLLILVQVKEKVNPTVLYYVTNAFLNGIVNITSLVLASISDIIFHIQTKNEQARRTTTLSTTESNTTATVTTLATEDHPPRTETNQGDDNDDVAAAAAPVSYQKTTYFGFILSAFYTGFAFGPSAPAYIQSHFHITLLSCGCYLLAFLVSVILLPETLPSFVNKKSDTGIRRRKQEEKTTVARVLFEERLQQQIKKNKQQREQQQQQQQREQQQQQQNGIIVERDNGDSNNYFREEEEGTKRNGPCCIGRHPLSSLYQRESTAIDPNIVDNNNNEHENNNCISVSTSRPNSCNDNESDDRNGIRNARTCNSELSPLSPSSFIDTIQQILLRPYNEMKILNRNPTIRYISLATLFNAMVYSTDTTLVLYYIEDQLHFNDRNIGAAFLGSGILGILMQGVFLQVMLQLCDYTILKLPLSLQALFVNNTRTRGEEKKTAVTINGEKLLLLLTYGSGIVHNTLYACSKYFESQSKTIIYTAFCVGAFTKLNYPILTSLASKAVTRKKKTPVGDRSHNTSSDMVHNNDNHHHRNTNRGEQEQGRIQGALFAITATGSAIGPVTSQFIYNRTKNCYSGEEEEDASFTTNILSFFLGPGTMFLFCALLYFIGTIFVALIPVGNTDDDSSDCNGASHDCDDDDSQEIFTATATSTENDRSNKNSSTTTTLLLTEQQYQQDVYEERMESTNNNGDQMDLLSNNENYLTQPLLSLGSYNPS